MSNLSVEHGLSVEHDLLLRAALLRGPEAVDAWNQWRTGTTMDALEPDSQWLLPLLDRNLRTLGIPGPALVRYHNVYRHNWYKNQLLLRQAETALGDPRVGTAPAEGNGVLLLGGAAMAVAHYDAIGARPFNAVEVLPPVHVAESRGTACIFLASLFGKGEDEAARRRAIPTIWKTLRVLTLDPIDQLLDLCLRREGWDRRSRLLWFADAVTLLRRHPGIEWEDVAARARRIGRTDAVSTARQLVEGWGHTGIAA